MINRRNSLSLTLERELKDYSKANPNSRYIPKKKEKKVENPISSYKANPSKVYDWYATPIIYSSKKTEEKLKVKKDFYHSDTWRNLKRKVLKTYGCKCMKCKTTDAVMHVDHIKPRSKHPTLELSFDNLQVLCKDCNEEKSNLNEIDYRNS